MYIVKIMNSIKQRGKRPEVEYKFIGELTPEVRQQWARVFSHAEAGISYKLITYAQYSEEQKQRIIEEQNKTTLIDRGKK